MSPKGLGRFTLIEEIDVHRLTDGDQRPVDSRERQGVYILNVRVGFEGALSEAEKSKLLEIVGRCPVHKLMTSATIDIRTSPL